jgi:hypothetical protein
VCDLPEALHLALAVVSALPGGGRCSVTRRCFCRKLPGPTRPDEEVRTPGTGKAEGPLIASIRDLNAQYHHNEVGPERVPTLMWGRSYQMATN